MTDREGYRGRVGRGLEAATQKTRGARGRQREDCGNGGGEEGIFWSITFLYSEGVGAQLTVLYSLALKPFI